MTYSNEDFERFYIRYKAEGAPRGVTLQGFCSTNKVPYNLFIKWYQDNKTFDELLNGLSEFFATREAALAIEGLDVIENTNPDDLVDHSLDSASMQDSST